MSQCVRCGCPDSFDVTSLGRSRPQRLCASCGNQWTEIPFHPAPAIGAMQGPVVPTPDQILHAAGLHPVA